MRDFVRGELQRELITGKSSRSTNLNFQVGRMMMSGEVDVNALCDAASIAVQKWALANPIAIQTKAPQDW